MAERKRPGFGAVKHIPEGVTCAWGARFIWPDDLVWDRQDMIGPIEERSRLEAWLNRGALEVARANARRLADSHELAGSEDRMVTLLDNDYGTIVANPQGSYGYLYVAAWMK